MNGRAARKLNAGAPLYHIRAFSQRSGWRSIGNDCVVDDGGEPGPAHGWKADEGGTWDTADGRPYTPLLERKTCWRPPAKGGGPTAGPGWGAGLLVLLRRIL